VSGTVLEDLDLVVDLNSEDESGLPWSFIDEEKDPGRIVEGPWVVVGEGTARAVVQMADIDGSVVRVRPLPARNARLKKYLTQRGLAMARRTWSVLSQGEHGDGCYARLVRSSSTLERGVGRYAGAQLRNVRCPATFRPCGRTGEAKSTDPLQRT